MSLAAGATEDVGQMGRASEAHLCCPLPYGLGDVTQELHPLAADGPEHVVGLPKGHVDHVVGRDRNRPALDGDGPGQLEERLQPDGVDGDHPVDRSAA